MRSMSKAIPPLTQVKFHAIYVASNVVTATLEYPQGGVQ
jgi:hypothetical protein